MDSKRQLTTRAAAVDLFAPPDRFASTSNFYGRLHRCWLVLGRYWWVVPMIVVLVLAPVYWLRVHSPPAYESKARMWVSGKLDIHEGRIYTEELIVYLSTQAKLLRTPAIQARALARLGAELPQSARHSQVLDKVKAFCGRLFASGSTNNTADSPFPFKVKVVEAPKSSILELRVVGTEAGSTRAFLHYLMEEYLSFKRESREKTSDRTVASVAGQVTQLAKDLEAQQEKLYAFQSSNNVVFLQEQGNSAGSYLAALNKQLANLRTELRLLQLLQPEQWVEVETGHKAVPSVESLPNEAKEMLASLAGPQLELFKANQQTQLLKAKRDELSQFLRPLHPKIIKLNEEIATQEKVAQISRNEAVKQMANRRKAVELEIQNLEAAFEEWDAKAIQASRKMADYERIRQDLQRLQAAYDKMLGLIQTVDVSKTVAQENLGILEPASPGAPLHRMMRNLVVAFVSSLFLGFGALFCLGKFRDDFASLWELSNQLSQEVVGQIPAISIKKTKGQLGFQALQKQRFEFLESFRNVRSSLLFMGNGKPKPKTIIIASSVPEEGKSTVALYLAATMAMGNSRVLLIDGDMRRGALHEFFGAESNPGLAEVLNGEIPPAKAIVRTGLDNLALLPAGRPNRNPGDLVLSPVWPEFLAKLKPQFDYILVDTPPVLAADDAASLAPKVDGVLFVVRGSFTSARMARGALDALRQRHVDVLGLIFNRAVSSPYENHYYRRYRHTYRWEPKERGGATAQAGNCAANAIRRQSV